MDHRIIRSREMFRVCKVECAGDFIDWFSAGGKHFLDVFNSKAVNYILDGFLGFCFEPVAPCSSSR